MYHRYICNVDKFHISDWYNIFDLFFHHDKNNMMKFYDKIYTPLHLKELDYLQEVIEMYNMFWYHGEDILNICMPYF